MAWGQRGSRGEWAVSHVLAADAPRPWAVVGAKGYAVSSFPLAGRGGRTGAHCAAGMSHVPTLPPSLSPKPSPFSRKSQKCPYLEHQRGRNGGGGLLTLHA